MAILKGFPPSNAIYTGIRMPIEEGKAKVIKVSPSDGTAQLLLPDGTPYWAQQSNVRSDLKINPLPSINEEVDYYKYAGWGVVPFWFYYSRPIWKQIKEVKILEGIFLGDL